MAAQPTPTTPRRTAVVHLVRRANGIEPFEAFMASYERFEAGVDHDLVLIFKGFDQPDGDAGPYLERAAAHSPRRIDVPDTGLDLTAYVRAARELDHDRVCFLNSFSEILVAGWLALLDGALADAGNGAAGASGSWASHLSYGLFQFGWRGSYARAQGSRREVRRVLQQLSGASDVDERVYWLATLANAARYMPSMVPFPAAHLRTNAFLVDRELFRSLRWGRLGSKQSTHRLESGRGSVTAQLRGRGRAAVVVDRHGVVRHEREWDAGDVLWQAEQQDLLVADNQTRMYADATAEQRAVLSRLAWGSCARPA